MAWMLSLRPVCGGEEPATDFTLASMNRLFPEKGEGGARQRLDGGDETHGTYGSTAARGRATGRGGDPPAGAGGAAGGACRSATRHVALCRSGSTGAGRYCQLLP